jgi:hypothetical protein
MKPSRLFLLGFCMLVVFSCRERNNMFDMGSDGFMPPPPIFWHDSLVTGIYHAIDSTLIGFRFRVEFADEFERTLLIHNELFYTDSLLFDQFDEMVGQGSMRYVHDVYDDINEGPYYLRMFFGGLPIGYVAFLVMGSNYSITIVDMGP